MEQQAWILRGLVAQFERHEAVDDEAANGIAAEYAVSSSSCRVGFVDVLLYWICSMIRNAGSVPVCVLDSLNR